MKRQKVESAGFHPTLRVGAKVHLLRPIEWTITNIAPNGYCLTANYPVVPPLTDADIVVIPTCSHGSGSNFCSNCGARL